MGWNKAEEPYIQMEFVEKTKALFYMGHLELKKCLIDCNVKSIFFLAKMGKKEQRHCATGLQIYMFP
jgi:hypothetical protein